MDDSFWGVDRRKSERALLKTDLFYSVEHPPEVKMKLGSSSETVCLVDLGEGGIGFISEVMLPQNTELDIAFDLPTKAEGDVKIHAKGIVRYCSSQGDSATYRVGLEFTEIDQKTKQFLAEYVKNFRSF